MTQLSPWNVTQSLLNQLSSELLGLGFTLEARLDGRYERYSFGLRAGPIQTVVVPLNPQAGDFEVLALEAIESARLVAANAGRVGNFLSAMASTHLVDVIRFSKQSAAVDGSIPWEQGEKLFSNARGALSASAKSTFDKQGAFGRELKGVSHQYMEAIRMGQTEVGSFVVTAFSPTTALVTLPKTAKRLSSVQATTDLSVTGRDITRTLSAALDATSEVVKSKNGNPNREFEEAIEEGVNRELLTAIANAVGVSVLQIELSGPKEGKAALSSTHVFEAGDVSRIRAGAAHIAQAFPRQAVELLGRVELVSRPKPGEFGIVRLEVREGSKANSVKIRLDEQQFEIAASSISREEFLRVRGNQEREGDTFWIYSPKLVTSDRGQVRLI